MPGIRRANGVQYEKMSTTGLCPVSEWLILMGRIYSSTGVGTMTFVTERYFFVLPIGDPHNKKPVPKTNGTGPPSREQGTVFCGLQAKSDH